MGQRIRIGDQVIEERLGTCMDMTMLYASLLESIDLHPILILVEGHIFLAVWLTGDAEYKDPIIRNGNVLLNDSRLRFIECTDMCSASHNISYEQAEIDGINRLKSYLSAQKFTCGIDVNKLRKQGILPINPPVIKDNNPFSADISDIELTSAPKPLHIRIIDVEGPQKAKGPTNKIELWESKLLDLSNTNKLLSVGRLKGIRSKLFEQIKDDESALFYYSKSYKDLVVESESKLIPLITSSLAELEDSLSDGEEFDVYPHPYYPISKVEKASFSYLAQHYNLFEEPEWGQYKFITQEFFRNEAQNRRVYCYGYPDDLNKNLKKIYTDAKTGEREFGINPLYLALGMLRWFVEDDDSYQQPYYAPLILAPVEIELKPGGNGYVFRKRNEDPQFNVTLLEKLRQEKGLAISGLNPLPTDEHGLDVEKIFAIVRAAVKELNNWDVTETAAIGIFDNSKISMWNDIHTAHEQLNQSKIVRSLIEQQTVWDKEKINRGPDDYMTFITLPVDATQLEAIDLAGRGNSFVLHGPPGTGKSQTITGMIGNALANHKTVLFVAKKPTALNVVRDRLAESLQIEDFCLALHTDTKKTDVLDQMDNTISKKDGSNFISFKDDVEKTEARGKELDVYREHLHKKQRYGLSLRELIDRYCREDDDAPYIVFHKKNTENLTPELLQNHIPMIDRMLSAYRDFDEQTVSLIPEIGISYYDGDIRSRITRLSEQYYMALKDVKEKADKAAELLHRDPPESSDELEELTKTIYEIRALAGSETNTADISAIDRNAALNYFSALEALEKWRSDISKDWKPEILKMKLSGFRKELAAAQKMFFLKRGKAIAEVTKKISYYSHRMLQDTEVPDVLDRLEAFQSEEARVEKIRKALPEATLEFLSEYPDAAAFQQAYEQGLEIQRKGRELSGGQELDDLRNDPRAYDTNQAFLDSMEYFRNIHREFIDLLNRPEEKRTSFKISDETEFCDFLLKNKNSIKKISVYNQYKEACINAGLEPVVQAFENGMKDRKVLITAYRRGLYYSLAQQAIYSDKFLTQFMGESFNNSISLFEKLETDLDQKSIWELHRRLASRLPSDSESKEIASQMTILRKAVKSRGRNTTLRQLFSQIPDILFRICPCMLMSPETVSQYLPQRNDLFDLVIFDEASQLETSHSVASLYRGKDAVIVGDPEQMPPTKFFGGGAAPVTDPSLEDMDSILDEALTIGLPSCYLKWHYRSSHESLIEFSNKNFYKNEMYTFPSVDDRARKVRMHKLEGNYKSSVNDKEAIEIVKEIKRRFEDPKTDPKDQIGIVAFNEKQQKKIMELLAKQCEKNRAFYDWISEELRKDHSRVEVKPLEQVQGDEWDTVIFSITFGPNEKGTVLQNFGPINKDGGEKRLNVAFSRARKEMLIYTSMNANDIKAGENSPAGVKAFHDFLDFVERINRDTTAEETGPNTDIYENEQSGIVKKLCKALEAEGYACVPHIGSSDFQIDIGVLNPYDPSRYLLGIMLDGDTYRITENTRDRELAQKYLLEKFRKWKIYRIWAMDWWEDRDFVIKRLLAYLEALKKEAAKTGPGIQTETAPKNSASDEAQTAALDAELVRQAEEVQAELDAEEAEEGKTEVSSDQDGEKDQEKKSSSPDDGNPDVNSRKPDTEKVPESDPEQDPADEKPETEPPVIGEGEKTNPEQDNGETGTNDGDSGTNNVGTGKDVDEKPVNMPDPKQEKIPEKFEPVNVPQPQEEETVITLSGLLEEAGVEVIDKRKNGGSLWIIGGRSLRPLAQRCREIGVNFHFKQGGGKATKGRDAWWTSDPDPAPVVMKVSGNSENTVRSAARGQEPVDEPVMKTSSAGETSAVPMTGFVMDIPKEKPDEPVAGSNIPVPALYDRTLPEDEDIPGESTEQPETQKEIPDLPNIEYTPEEKPYQGTLYTGTEIAPTPVGWQDYCLPSNKAEIARRAVMIVEGEKVIEKEKLIEKLRLSFGVRTGNEKVVEATEKALKAAKIKTTKIKGILYCWASDIDPKMYTGYQYHDEIKRKDDELPLPEIRNAIVRTLMDFGPLDEDDLLTRTARTFGYQRLGQNLKIRLAEGIAFAVSDRKIRLNRHKKYELREE